MSTLGGRMVFNTLSSEFEMGDDIWENCHELRGYIKQIKRASNLPANPKKVKVGEPHAVYPTELVRPEDVGHAIRARVDNLHLGKFMSGPRTREAGIPVETWARIAAQGLSRGIADSHYSRPLSDVGIIVDNNAPPYLGSAKILREALPGILAAITSLLDSAEQFPDSNLAPAQVQIAAEMLQPLWAKYVEHRVVQNPHDAAL